MTAPEIRVIDINLIDPDPMNPQEQDLATFNELCDDIRDNGMLESVTVVPYGEGRYRLVAGEHRWKAAKVVGLAEVPAIVVDPARWNEDERQIQLVKMNVIKGKLDPGKFLELWAKLKVNIPNEDDLKRRMGFDAKDAFIGKLLRDTTKNLPDEMKQDIAKRKGQIRNVDDLHATVNSLFAQYGSTLESGFIIFSFLGQTHMMVRTDADTFEPIRLLAEKCAEQGIRFDETLAKIVSDSTVTSGLLGEPV